jgi:hypothetical protein
MERDREEQKALEEVVRRLLETIKKENLGMNQVVYHKEWYE